MSETPTEDDFDPRKRFSATADLYDRHRPSYPAALIDWLIATAELGPGARVADLGCGTGIATRLFAARGLDVIGIDPNEEMLAKARAVPGPARYQRGEAAATGLPDGSIELSTAGQAFHWFDLPSTFVELRRIAAPGGWAAAFWNLRAQNPFMDEYDRILRAFSPEYGQAMQSRDSHEELRDALREARETELGNAQTLDWEGFHGRVWSSSYVMHGVARGAELDRALAELFGRFARDGRCEMTYRVVAIAWQPAAQMAG